MNKLKTLFCAVFTLLLVNATAQADSSNFAGPYVGISGSGYGVQMDGESNSSSGGTTETDNVSVLANSPPTSSYWSFPSFNLATSDPSKKVDFLLQKLN